MQVINTASSAHAGLLNCILDEFQAKKECMQG
jgi:hypothetical protein